MLQCNLFYILRQSNFLFNICRELADWAQFFLLLLFSNLLGSTRLISLIHTTPLLPSNWHLFYSTSTDTFRLVTYICLLLNVISNSFAILINPSLLLSCVWWFSWDVINSFNRSTLTPRKHLTFFFLSSPIVLDRLIWSVHYSRLHHLQNKMCCNVMNECIQHINVITWS